MFVKIYSHEKLYIGNVVIAYAAIECGCVN